jgi:hypothetical protein
VRSAIVACVSERAIFLQLPALTFCAALVFLFAARLLWSPHAFGLLAQPLLFLLTLLALTLIFYYLTLVYLLARRAVKR